MDEDKIIPMIDERSVEILADLEKTDKGDNSYTVKTKNLETLQKIKGEQEVRDQNRFNNNAKIEIEELKLKLEEERLKVQKLGNWINGGQTLTYAALGCLMAKISYDGNLKGMADKGVMGMAKDLFNKATSFFVRSR